MKPTSERQAVGEPNTCTHVVQIAPKGGLKKRTFFDREKKKTLPFHLTTHSPRDTLLVHRENRTR